MSDHIEQQVDEKGSEGKSRPHAFHAHAKISPDAEPEHEAVSRIRERHKQHVVKAKKKPKRRWVFWAQMLGILVFCGSVALTIRAIEMATIRSGGVPWSEDLVHGRFERAGEKFSLVAKAAAEQTFSSDATSKTLLQDFNAALPHLKKAGYILTEMEVEIGIPPKLIPHFYHDPDIKLDLEKTLKGLGDNNIGAALIIALAEAGDLQKQLEVADMQFNHIEVELGPIPSLKLQYKNDSGIKSYIHKD
ncbi:MAG: hypothetical protein CO187_05825 [Zetaproteobacteria bacterium CG_4_9_14_3_um_filter_53_7]|nr:MAG: hypothetical protein CO187_05825 [Zetaproteobacteria bacterium CG_4_9_14_3_um_filter_53_7]